MIRDVKALLFLVVVVVVITLLVIEPNFNAYAHYFTPDQSAEFLSLIHQINVEISLINMTELVKIIELNFCSSQTYR
jgi:alpha-N-acetylglucosamine transferase